ncbi:MAG: GerMN domain-containing protein [Acidobacteriia bacterium]|nr:GerMN domain-containing protein [Terriglobia bacterium]
MIPRHFQITFALLLATALISGLYMIHLTQGERAKTQASGYESPVAAPIAGRQERIRILVAYDEDRVLRWRETTVFMPEDRLLRVREALRAVLAEYLQSPSPHPLGRGVDIKDVYMINADTVVIDTTPQFAAAHPSSALLEQMTMVSLVETLSANVPGINRVKFLVDGHERDTLAGHVDLMSFYSVDSMHKMAEELE